jgi:hypothetical protein
METLNISFNAFKAAFPKTDKVYAVTSTQWADGTGSKQVVDLYAVKSGYLMQCSVLESELLHDYASLLIYFWFIYQK